MYTQTSGTKIFVAITQKKKNNNRNGFIFIFSFTLKL